MPGATYLRTRLLRSAKRLEAALATYRDAERPDLAHLVADLQSLHQKPWEAPASRTQLHLDYRRPAKFPPPEKGHQPDVSVGHEARRDQAGEEVTLKTQGHIAHPAAHYEQARGAFKMGRTP